MPAFYTISADHPSERLGGNSVENTNMPRVQECSQNTNFYAKRESVYNNRSHAYSLLSQFTSPTPDSEGTPGLSGTPEQTPPKSPLDTPSRRTERSREVSSGSPSPTPIQVPPPRPTHSRRRDPNHVPRPRNAFIFFRSAYVNQQSESQSNGEGQQNEMSKHAAKVWNKMNEEQKAPYQQLAALEKQEHAKKYPHYIYSPGKFGNGSRIRPSGRKSSGGRTSGGSQKRRNSKSELVASPGLVFASTLPAREARVPRAAAQRAIQRFAQSPSPSYDSSGRSASPEALPMELAPILNIAASNLAPVEKAEDRQPEFYIPDYDQPMLESLQEEHYGFKHYLGNGSMYATMPPVPRSASHSPLPPPFSSELSFDGDYNLLSDGYAYSSPFNSFVDNTGYYPASTDGYTFDAPVSTSGLYSVTPFSQELPSTSSYSSSYLTSNGHINTSVNDYYNTLFSISVSPGDVEYTTDPELMGLLHDQAALFDQTRYTDDN